MGFGRFGSFGGGSIEIIGMPKIVATGPERKIRNPLGPGSMLGVEIEPVPETNNED